MKKILGFTLVELMVVLTVIGLLLAGSLAHGYATPESDVDVMIVVSDAEHQKRIKEGGTCFFSRELCTYPEGYVDGKYTSLAYLDEVEQRGSEPARFAFQDARVLFTRDPSLTGRLQGIARYPVEEKAARLWRFQAQFEAWYWYCSQALAKIAADGDPAASKAAFFDMAQACKACHDKYRAD